MKSDFLVPKLVLLITMIIMTWVSSNVNWGKENWRGILESDAKGYYAYLPAVFIYKDLNFSFLEEIENEKYIAPHLYYDYRSNSHGVLINKYYCGTAIAQLPFFIAAHGISYLTKQDQDGYSKWYPIFTNLAALFYQFLGLLYLMKLLRSFNINQVNTSICLIAAAFGTNLFAYTIVEPGMSHVFSFAFVTLFLYYSKQYFTFQKKRDMYILALVLGLIVLIRPINGLIVFFSLYMAGSWKNFVLIFSNRIKKWKSTLLAVFLFLTVVSIQFIIYKISTGHFFVYSYAQEGFDFTSPHFVDILFSYKKGLFLYTPIYFIALLGGYYLFHQSIFRFISWFGFFMLITYVFSSWWMWFYGGSFSSRVYVEYISLFMLLMAIALQHIKSKKLKNSYIALIGILVVVCQIQTYQYRYYQLHYSEMTKEKYWDIFLRIDKL